MSSYHTLEEEYGTTATTRTEHRKDTEDDRVPLLISTWADVESDQSDGEGSSLTDRATIEPISGPAPPKSVRQIENPPEKDSISPNYHKDNPINDYEEIETPHIAAPPTPHSTNPFASDDDMVTSVPHGSVDRTTPGQCNQKHSANPQTNPFADDYDEETIAIMAAKKISPRSEGGSTNPFAEDYNPSVTQGSPSPQQHHHNQKIARRSSACPRTGASPPHTPKFEKRRSAPLLFPSDRPEQDESARGNPVVTDSVSCSTCGGSGATVPPAMDSPVIQGTNKLLRLGFTPKAAYRAMLSEGSFDAAIKLLRRNLSVEAGVKVSGTSPLWNPPLVVRIGSWMPSPGNQQHVEYFITVKPHGTDRSYVIMKRFSHFYDLKSRVSRHSYEAGNPLDQGFVDDRIGTFLFGSSEETYYTRQSMLDKWLRYLCLNHVAMTHPVINSLVLDFLEFDNFVLWKPVIAVDPDAPWQVKVKVHEAGDMN